MKFSNIVRWEVKEGQFEELMEIFAKGVQYEGMLQMFVVKTGEHTGCSVGIWESEAHIQKARPEMIGFLDSIRDKLVVLSEEMGVTDPVSGPIIYER